MEKIEVIDLEAAAIAERIEERRNALGYSYQDLADACGLSKSTLQRYVTQNIKNIPLSKIKPLAAALKVSPQWLMGWDKETVSINPEALSGDFKKVAEDLIKIYKVGAYADKDQMEKIRDVLGANRFVIETLVNNNKKEGDENK